MVVRINGSDGSFGKRGSSELVSCANGAVATLAADVVVVVIGRVVGMRERGRSREEIRRDEAMLFSISVGLYGCWRVQQWH